MSIDRPREQHTEEHEEPPRDIPAEGDTPDTVGGAQPAAAAESAREPESAPEPAETSDATSDEAPGQPPRAARTLPVLLAIAAVAFLLDLGTKSLVVAKMTPHEPISIIGDVVRLTLVRNPGAAFSMATGMTWLLTLIAAAVVIGVIRIGRSLRSVGWAIGLGLVLGGAIGNLVDRLFRAPGPLQGYVVDFISVTRWWPVFNVADSSIVCGAILLVALTVFGFEPDGTRSRHGRGGDRA